MRRKLEVSHNDILRSLLGVLRYTSVRTLFINKQQDNVDVATRKQSYSLKLGSKTLITALLNLFLIRALSRRLSYLLNCVILLKLREYNVVNYKPRFN